ncbi:RNA polymerase sigma factor [Halalkalibacter hemicellulosilyticus]|uniref:RNA polymerase sigma-70 factor n=1 Tax=Halalkalibacter hemicellulosilyticusJCM 9152 TaxID=1236971 RepID=W4QD44_9BACI|nr:RNA polymerase sigma factor [Halalkalibacter hemicellulosilyticus]GAE29603.1 RNA polymerase sigma-70 factor [Halalkalibacter hemicellulosilyticusJCM 9152]
MPTDQELIEEILNGSQAAMEVLVKRHYKLIFSYVYRKVGDYHLAYDMTQEVFIKMMKSITRYNNSGEFKNWLLKIAVNQCRDYFRSSAYKMKAGEEELGTHVPSHQESVWDLVSKKADSEKVKAAVTQLPDYQREVIILRFYHGLKVKEISEVTNSKEATVKSRVKQGVEKLRRWLKGGDEGEEKRSYR